MAEQATTESPERARADEHARHEELVHQVAELTEELRQRAEESTAPQTFGALASRDADRAGEMLLEAQVASIKLTYPEDWVLFEAKDGARVCFLQDVGCSRVRPYWEVSFERFDPRRDMEEEEIEGELFVEATVIARSRLTGEEVVEIGNRSSIGFFEKAWHAAKDKPIERRQIRSSIRKAALANARGRVIRTISGLGAVPVMRLQEVGLDTSRIRGVKFEQGTRGGTTSSSASEKQLQRLTMLVTKEQKVRGFDRSHYEAVFSQLQESGLSKHKASSLIDALSKVEEPWGLEALGRAVGREITGGGPAEGGEGQQEAWT